MEQKTTKKTLIISSAMLAVYTVLTFIGAINHEIWFDEGQAWCIARDNDIAGIIDQMKYEGHPPLWHFILYPFAHLGCSVDILPLISWFFSVVTVALILWKSPFHLLINISVVFSSGFLFYNSVTSRVYCLIPFFLCLIAMVYPNRRKHPLVFGLLVALLTNTHLIMCGLVGILGIYMIIDLIKGWKTVNLRQNLLNIGGLAIAGIGVVLMVIPLIQSLTVSEVGSAVNISFDSLVYRTFNSLFNVGLYLLPIEEINTLTYLLCYAFSVLIIILMIIMRHYRKMLLATGVYTVFFIIVTQIVFNMMLPTRAAIYIYTLFFIIWMFRSCETPKTTGNEKKEIVSESKLVNKVIGLDIYFDRTLDVIMAILMLFSVPRGVFALFNDYSNKFCVSRSTAEYIESYLPPDSVIVANKHFCAQVSAYIPETKFYSVMDQKYITHTVFSVPSDKINWEKVYDDLKHYENVYYMAISLRPIETGRTNVIYTDSTNAEARLQMGWVEITPLDVEKEIVPLIGTDSTPTWIERL